MAVEWVFGDKLTYFALMDYKKDLKIGLSPVNKMYTISTLLRNALTSWLYGNTSTFFSTFFSYYPTNYSRLFSNLKSEHKDNGSIQFAKYVVKQKLDLVCPCASPKTVNTRTISELLLCC